MATRHDNQGISSSLFLLWFFDFLVFKQRAKVAIHMKKNTRPCRLVPLLAGEKMESIGRTFETSRDGVLFQVFHNFSLTYPES
jgi:hypothetical protein